MLGATQQHVNSVPPVEKNGSFVSIDAVIQSSDLQTFVTRPNSDRIHRFLSYWMALRGSHPLPRRSDLDPLAIPSVLNGIWLITVDTDTNSFHSRLAGEAVNRFFGRTMAGSDIADALPERAMEPLHTQLRRVRDNGCMLLEQGNLLRPDGATIRGERLLAPFATAAGDAGVTVDHIVGVTIASGPVSRPKLARTATPTRLYEVPLL
ncbi:MAG: PAS domain-containing protein [Alphaproteobacteria bacterium]